MAVEDFDEIDDIQFSEDNECYLIIEDSLDWEEEYLHASTIQNKLKTYIYFVESGQLLTNYPDAEGKTLVICLRALQDAPDKFFDEMNGQITKLLNEKGISFLWEFAVD